MHHRHDEVLARHDLQSPRPPHRAIRRRQTSTSASSASLSAWRSVVKTTERLRNSTENLLKLHERFGRNAV